jgi:hypothetical protein
MANLASRAASRSHTIAYRVTIVLIAGELAGC